jgi:hypothetical protein
VSWDEKEPSGLPAPHPRERQVRRGTTVAVDWKTRRVRARLTSDSTAGQRSDRDTLLRRMAGDGTLRLETLDGVLRVRAAARMLHITVGPATGEAPAGAVAAIVPKPPPGVDAGAFYDLVEFRRRGYGDSAPTSIVRHEP